MHGHITQLDCRWRWSGPPEGAARLRRIAAERLGAALDAALDAALADDPTVYVLRRVECRTALGIPVDAADADVAERLGERLAGAVLRAVARADDQCVTFADQAAYVARFCADLLRGDAWGRWYYGAFAGLRHLPPADALRAVLRANAADSAAILGALQQLDALEALLHTLDPAAIADLWTHGMLPAACDPAEAQLFFAHAVRLIDQLDLWAGARPGRDLLAAYLATRPAPAHWGERRGLALALVQVVRFLAGQGLLRRVPVTEQPALQARIAPAIATLDWLDGEFVGAQLVAIVTASPDLTPARPRPAGATPRQRALLADLEALIRERGALLNRAQPGSAANAIRLHTWLIERDPAWAEGVAPALLIDRLLRAWAELAALPQRTAALAQLRRGNLTGPLRPLADLGAPAAALLDLLVHGGDPQPDPAQVRALPTECAGVALLLRAALDLQLPALLHRARLLPALSPDEELRVVVLALLLRLAGAAGAVAGRIAPGLTALAGWHTNGPATLADLAARCNPAADAPARFQAALFHTLRGQRLIGGATPHLHLVDLPHGASALIAGDGAANLWPLGAVVHSPAELRDALAAWRTRWADLTGHEPAWIAGPELAASLGDAEAVGVLAADAAAQARHGQLVTTLTALGHGQLGLPAFDLTIALTAAALLRAWCRWLPNFADSSVPYVLAQFIDRPGAVILQPDGLLVELAPRPLDIMLQMSGYNAPIERVPWLAGRAITFRIGL
jgi:hypothetical protein